MLIDAEKQFEYNEFLRRVKIRYLVGNQNIFLITGNTNSGKTVFAVLLYYLIKKGLLKQKVDLKDTKIYFNLSDFAQEISKLKNEIIFYDEAGRDLDIGEWNNIFNKTLRHILQTQRIRKNFYFIIVPHRRFISQVTLPLFNFLIVIHSIIIETQNEIKQERIANVYDIQTQHFTTITPDYFLFKTIARFKIPNINEIENKDFRQLLKYFKKIEIQKKNEIAREIEEEMQMLNLKTKAKILKAKKEFLKAQKDLEKLSNV